EVGACRVRRASLDWRAEGGFPHMACISPHEPCRCGVAFIIETLCLPVISPPFLLLPSRHHHCHRCINFSLPQVCCHARILLTHFGAGSCRWRSLSSGPLKSGAI